MRSHNLAPITATILSAALILTAAQPATAAPVPSAIATLKTAVESPVEQVRHRGRRGAGIAAGVIGGLVIGSLIAGSSSGYGGYYYYGAPSYYPGPYYAPRYYYYEPPPVYYRPYRTYHYAPPRSRSWLAYCYSRYRSFDARTGTYLGYDGRRHYCR